MKFIVINTVTESSLVYTDINKARIALSYLNFLKPDTPWHMEIVVA